MSTGPIPVRLKAFRKIGDSQPIVEDVSIVVIEGKHGQPVVVAADLGGGAIAAEVAKPDTQDAFNRILQSLGFDRVVIVDDLSKELVPPESQNKLPLIIGRK